MKTWTPDTSDPVAEWHRGQLNDQVRRFRELYGDDLITKVLRTRQTPLSSRDYLRLLGKSRGEVALVEALTAPAVTKARSALGGNPPAGGREVGKGSVTYAPGYSDAELAALLARARTGDPSAQAEWQAYARMAPIAAGELIKAANAAVTKGKRRPKARGTYRRGRVRVTSGESDELASQAAAFERRARQFHPDPLARPAPVTKAAQAAIDYEQYSEYLSGLASSGNPSLRAAALAYGGFI